MSAEPTQTVPRHRDVVIIGAGISGIGAAHYVAGELPGKSYTILEARDSPGGTWDLFRYPGVRSDSDLFTFGYGFRPWREDVSIAKADRIMSYLRETVEEEGTAKRIEYGRRVVAASWSSRTALWTLRVQGTHGDEAETLTCSWIFSATGYYRYDQGYAPAFEGRDRFRGPVVHPQHWPQDLDHAGKRVVVIGSGATAVTVVPAMAATAGHVTQLQRTPSYVLAQSARDPFAIAARKLLGDGRGHALARRKNILVQRWVWKFCQRFPTVARRFIRRATAKQLPNGYPVDVHFNPPYDPWDQRLCLAPDGDYFAAIRSGRASIVTDRVRTFTETGIELESGRALEADIIVTATGLNVLPLGGIRLDLDGEPVDFAEHVVYRGMMLDGVPNFAFAIGYTNASWTLKVGLLCEYLVRLLKYMEANSWAVCAPVLPADAGSTRPFLDFGAGYIQRSIQDLPRQGQESPWLMSKDYHDDVRLLRRAPVQDGNLAFRREPEGAPSGRRTA
ncbi:flavin-containing monooxygenase [Nocardiopsis ansamitocini]|nr:NAD(P)/FAD-dependent oxidoreductase [Nocardiopsis ansamitocini]